MEATTRKPHRDWTGYMTERKHGSTHAVVIDGNAAGLDTTDGRWQTVCSAHGTILTSTSFKAAREWAKAGPVNWCECCDGACEAPCPSCGRAN